MSTDQHLINNDLGIPDEKKSLWNIYDHKNMAKLDNYLFY